MAVQFAKALLCLGPTLTVLFMVLVKCRHYKLYYGTIFKCYLEHWTL